MATIKGNKKRIRQAKNHRWMVDYEDSDLAHLSAADQEYMRLFLNEYYFNTRESDTSKQIHKDFIKDGKTVNAMTNEGYGLYKAYNDAERDLYSRMDTHFSSLLRVGEASEDADSNVDSSDMFPAAPSHEDRILAAEALRREAQEFDLELDIEKPGVRRKKITVSIVTQDGVKTKVSADTYIVEKRANAKTLTTANVIVSNMQCNHKLWPDDRERATLLLQEARVRKGN